MFTEKRRFLRRTVKANRVGSFFPPANRRKASEKPDEVRLRVQWQGFDLALGRKHICIKHPFCVHAG